MDRTLAATQGPGVYRRNLSAFRLAVVHDGMLPTAFADWIGVDPAEGERLHRAAFRPVPPRLSCNAFVIERAGRLMLVDAGCGDTAPDAGLLGRGLAALGLSPADIDVVLMTHLHRDHAAGLLDPQGRALFPRAEIVVHRDELAFWQDARSLGRLRPSQQWDFAIAGDVLAAYADRLRPIDDGPVLPGIAAVPTPGHTPGQVAFLLEGERDSLLITGDVVHLPALQFSRPEISVAYDLDPVAAAETRARLLDRLAAERLLLAGVHLDFPCFGHVGRLAGGGFTYHPEPWTSDLEA